MTVRKDGLHVAEWKFGIVENLLISNSHHGRSDIGGAEGWQSKRSNATCSARDGMCQWPMMIGQTVVGYDSPPERDTSLVTFDDTTRIDKPGGDPIGYQHG